VLCYIDLDQFKLVNDVCGHAAGDELLRQVSKLLAKRLRNTDTLARLGGDEFGILLPACGIAKGLEIAEALREDVRAFRFPWEGREFAVGASVGVVPIDVDTESLSKALRQADAACYAAKDGGRNRVHLYQPDDEDLAARSQQMAWVHRIQEAIDQGRFRLYYQAICPTRGDSGDSGAFEVLLRMLNSDGSEVMPGAFMPAAERYNLMADIDAWVVDRTLAWLGDNRDRLTPAVTRCAINLSGESIGNERLLGRIEELFQRHRVPPQLICFEITETAAIANLQQAMSFIGRLKALGCRFALDDFGSGLSSFGYLKNLQVDFLKIDGAFIKDIHRNSVDYAMVQSINAIGHVMGLQTIAEFVESAEIVAALAELGVDYVQGYHVGRPRPLAEYGTSLPRPASAVG
jgi:Amt family ammonium transporter